MNLSFHVPTADPRDPVEVHPRTSMADRINTDVVIGVAPDGLPLVLSLHRRIPLGQQLRSVLGDLQDLPPEVRVPVDALAAAVGRFALQRGMVEVDGQPGYETSLACKSLFGPTLLARLIGGVSPLVRAMQGAPAAAESDPRFTASTAIPIDGACDPQGASSTGGLGGRLFVPLTEGARPRVVFGSRTATVALPPPRLFGFESLVTLGGQAVFRSPEEGRGPPIPLGDTPRYQRHLEDRGASVGFQVPRVEVGRGIVRLARRVGALHQEQLVHGDLKPDNVLLLEDGPQLIDALALRTGDVAPAGTPGWAAPEQMMARAVAPATDVFALALMTASLLGAAVYGEERSFLMPTGGTRCTRVRLLSSPDVFLDTTRQDLSTDAVRAYRALIVRGLAFDPDARMADATSFADALASRLEEHPLPGSLAPRRLTGRLHRAVRIDGRTTPAWILADDRTVGM